MEEELPGGMKQYKKNLALLQIQHHLFISNYSSIHSK
jgi:hypothetical protein